MEPNAPEDKWDTYHRDVQRHDPVLVAVVQRLGKVASGRFADLRIWYCNEGALYKIDEYDGYETVVFPSKVKWVTCK